MNEIVLCEECIPNKKSNICIEQGCKTRSTYNIEGEKKLYIVLFIKKKILLILMI